MTEIKLQDSVETVCRDETEELVDNLLKKLRETKLEECFGSDYIQYLDGDIEVHRIEFRRDNEDEQVVIADLRSKSTTVGTQRGNSKIGFDHGFIEPVVKPA